MKWCRMCVEHKMKLLHLTISSENIKILFRSKNTEFIQKKQHEMLCFFHINILLTVHAEGEIKLAIFLLLNEHYLHVLWANLVTHQSKLDNYESFLVNKQWLSGLLFLFKGMNSEYQNGVMKTNAKKKRKENKNLIQYPHLALWLPSWGLVSFAWNPLSSHLVCVMEHQNWTKDFIPCLITFILILYFTQSYSKFTKRSS